MGNLLEVIAVPIVTIIIGAAVAAEVKHSNSLDEAYRRIIKVFVEVFFWVWLAYLIYHIYSFSSSEEPLTRAAVVSIAIHCSSAAFFVMARFLLKLFKLFDAILDLQSRHLHVTENFFNK